MSQAEVIVFAVIFFGGLYLFSRWAKASDDKWSTRLRKQMQRDMRDNPEKAAEDDRQALRRHWEREDHEAERRAWVDGDKNARPPWRR